MNYLDLGYDGFLQKSLLLSARMSPAEARNSIPSGSLSAELLSAPLNAATDIIFSSSDGDTAAWTAGTIYFADGTSSGQIAAGDTSDIAATTYVYYDRDSPGALKTTTDPSTASGAQKLILAMVSEGVTGKDCKIIPTIGIGLVVSGIVAAQIAAGTITAAEITVDNLQALSANMGTVNVGGSGNGNGILNVKDTAGNNKVVLNSDGIAINSGKMTIKDDEETTVIDAKGLVSTANFVSDSVENSTGRTYSNAAAYEDIANTSITTSSLARSTEVLILYTINVVEFPINGTTAFAGKVTLRIDSTDQVGNNFELQLTSLSPIANAPAWGGPLTAVGIVTLAAGTHTLKLRAQTINTNSQLNVETTSVVYIVLGK